MNDNLRFYEDMYQNIRFGLDEDEEKTEHMKRTISLDPYGKMDSTPAMHKAMSS